MSLFKVSIVARNTKNESLISPPVEVLVDTGSELTWLPKDVLTGIHVIPVRKRSFSTVVFAEPGDLALLGVRTVEGFGVRVDNIGHRFVATTTLVARIRQEAS